jgi:hypothetical protein
MAVRDSCPARPRRRQDVLPRGHLSVDLRPAEGRAGPEGIMVRSRRGSRRRRRPLGERTSRFVIIAGLPEGKNAGPLADVLIDIVNVMPDKLRQSAGSTGGCDTPTMMVGADGSNHRWRFQHARSTPRVGRARGDPGRVGARRVAAPDRPAAQTAGVDDRSGSGPQRWMSRRLRRCADLRRATRAGSRCHRACRLAGV